VKSKSLWQISVATNPEAEAAVAEFLEAVLGQPPVSWTSAETGTVMVSVYLPTQPPSISAALAQRLARLRRQGFKIGSGKIQMRKIRREDWAESWKRHFRPIRIGSTLLVKPGWSKQRAQKNQAVVILDPGLSFGTGHHPTTAFCLQRLAIRRGRGLPQSFLDIGTGSGILAIAAAKLGYLPVEAFDFDPEAVRVARANARKNRVFDRLRIREADLTRLPARRVRRYDLICANFISTLLVQEAVRILAYLKPGGTLVLAGILRAEFTKVQQCYERMGLRLVNCRTDREWRSGAFILPVRRPARR
jgi:ribosomal protein L11 methyltransferase